MNILDKLKNIDTLKKTGFFVFGDENDGEYKTWAKNGNISQRLIYKNGVAVQITTYNMTNSKILSVSNYDYDGKLHGPQIYINGKTDKLSAISTYYHSELHGMSVEFYYHNGIKSIIYYQYGNKVMDKQWTYSGDYFGNSIKEMKKNLLNFIDSI